MEYSVLENEENAVLLENVVGDECPASPATSTMNAVPTRTMNWWKLAALAYVTVCGGPFGMEPAVQAAGALPVLIMVGVLAIFWAMPQALMTAEMSTMFPVNGGYIVWVTQGLGRYWACITSFNSVLSNFMDVPLYPVMLAGYVSQEFPSVSNAWLTALKFFALLVVAALNIKGMECVSITSAVFTVIFLTPFVIEPFLTHWEPSVWNKSVRGSIDWSSFMSTIMWNYQGWDGLGAIAGEVSNPKVAFPVGVSAAVAATAIFYALPVMVGTSVQPDFSAWGNGYFLDLAKRLHKWLGYFMLVAACIANVSQFNGMISTTSRVLQSVANYRMMPKILTWNPKPFATPIPAIIVMSVVCGVLMNLSFGILVVLDSMFRNISLFIEFAAFLALKFRRPDVLRPYEVPGHKLGAVLVSVPPFGIICYALYSVGWSVALAVGIGCNVLIFIAAYFWVKHVPDGPTRQYGGMREGSHGSLKTHPSLGKLKSPLLNEDSTTSPYPDAFGTPSVQVSYKVPGGYRESSNHGTPFRENSKL